MSASALAVSGAPLFSAGVLTAVIRQVDLEGQSPRPVVLDLAEPSALVTVPGAVSWLDRRREPGVGQLACLWLPIDPCSREDAEAAEIAEYNPDAENRGAGIRRVLRLRHRQGRLRDRVQQFPPQLHRSWRTSPRACSARLKDLVGRDSQSQKLFRSTRFCELHLLHQAVPTKQRLQDRLPDGIAVKVVSKPAFFAGNVEVRSRVS